MKGNAYIGNRGGIPVVTTTATVNASNVLITLPNHMFKFLGNKGIFIVTLTTKIAGTPTTTPVVFSVNNDTLPLTNDAGTAVTIADISNTLTFEVYFDKSLNVLRVLTVIS